MLDKYLKEKAVYYVNESAYDGFVGNRQDYHDYKTLKSCGATREEDKFFTELHYRKVPIKGGQILVLAPREYQNLPTEEYVHWSGYRVLDNDLKHLQL